MEISLDQLNDFATQVANDLKPGSCVCLSGEMGTGKTTFSFFLTKALIGKTSNDFSSPTFTILNQYENPSGTPIYHMDLYRLDDFESLEDIDLLQFLNHPKAIALVEWGEKFSELKDYYTHEIQFDFVKGVPDKRNVSYKAF